MRQSTSKFMDYVNLKIGNEKFASNLGYTQFDTINHNAFGDPITDDNNDVPHEYKESTNASPTFDLTSIKDALIHVIDQYLSFEEIDDYPGPNIFVPSCDGIEPVIGLVKRPKRDSNSNFIGVKYDNLV